jgi:hypothetical protein
MADLPKQLPPDVAAALSRGNLIEAIKLLRGKYNIGLAEAKAFLEAVQKQAQVGTAEASAARAKVHASMTPMQAHAPHPHAVAVAPHPSNLSPGEMPRTSSEALFAAVVVAILFVLGTAVYFS